MTKRATDNMRVLNGGSEEAAPSSSPLNRVAEVAAQRECRELQQLQEELRQADLEIDKLKQRIIKNHLGGNQDFKVTRRTIAIKSCKAQFRKLKEKICDLQDLLAKEDKKCNDILGKRVAEYSAQHEQEHRELQQLQEELTQLNLELAGLYERLVNNHTVGSADVKVTRRVSSDISSRKVRVRKVKERIYDLRVLLASNEED